MSAPSDTMWSRRRAAVQAEAETDQKVAKQAVVAQVQAEQAQKSDDEILRELSLQDPDQMQAGDDFSAFMRDEVPARLRKRALRTLWRSNPVLACVDDLVDYGDDFKAEWNATGVIKTAYRVGKGMLAHVEEMERQEKLAALEAEPGSEPDTAQAGQDDDLLADTITDTDTDISAPLLVSEEDAGITVVTTAAALLDPASEQDSEQDEDNGNYTVMRRMRFEFDGAS